MKIRLDDMAKLEEHIPRLGMLYGMLMQGRNQELSLVQRVNSMVLYDNLCDQKVFDRLQPLGVTMSYSTNNSLLDMIGGHFDSKVVEAVARHRRFRLIGDNINLKTDPGKEREDHHSEWNHALGLWPSFRIWISTRCRILPLRYLTTYCLMRHSCLTRRTGLTSATTRSST